MQVTIISHLYYSNTLPSGVPAFIPVPLQLVLNLADSMILLKDKLDHSYSIVGDCLWPRKFPPLQDGAWPGAKTDLHVNKSISAAAHVGEEKQTLDRLTRGSLAAGL